MWTDDPFVPIRGPVTRPNIAPIGRLMPHLSRIGRGATERPQPAMGTSSLTSLARSTGLCARQARADEGRDQSNRVITA